MVECVEIHKHAYTHLNNYFSALPNVGGSHVQRDRRPFNGLFSMTSWVSLHQKVKTNVDFNEARDDGGGNGISWTICKSYAPQHSIFYRPDTPPDAQPAGQSTEGVW